MALPAAQPGPASDPKPATAFARKYGVSTMNPFRQAGKSGFTPTDPIHTILPQTAEELKTIEAINTFQGKWFAGFSTRTLEDMGAFPDPDATIEPLTNPIHPIFSRWETSKFKLDNRPSLPLDLQGDKYTIPKTNTGLWTYDNPFIYEVLDPVLRLASRFLTNMHTSQWLAAFLTGPYTPLPPTLDPRPLPRRSKPLYTFRRRCPTSSSSTLEQFNNLLPVLQQKLFLTISDGRFHEKDRKTPEPKGAWYARTSGYPGKDGESMAGVLLSVSTQALQPLLRNDLSASERLAEQVFVAIIVVHEIAHALNLAVVGHPEYPWHSAAFEPYFEGEVVAELGWSFTSTLLGGAINPFFHRTIDDALPVPRLGFFLTDWPNAKYFQGDGTVIGGIRALRPEPSWKPILAAWYEAVQRDGFWDYGVGQLGLGMVRAWGEESSKTLYEDGVGGVGKKVKEYEMQESGGREWERYMRALRTKQLGLMDAGGREAARETDKLEETQRRALAQRDFRGKREILAKEIEVVVEDAKIEGPRAFGRLLEKLWEEALEERDELLELIRWNGLNDPNFVRHKSLLSRLNRHLRHLLASLVSDCVYFKNVQVESDTKPVAALLARCQNVLGDEGNAIQDPTAYLRELDVMFTANDPAQIYSPADSISTSSDISTTLAAAKAAHESHDEQAVHDIAFELSLLSVDGDKLPKLVARISDIGNILPEKRLEEVEDILRELEGLKGANEGQRGYWVGVMREMLAEEKKRVAAGAGKRKFAPVRGHVRRVRRDEGI